MNGLSDRHQAIFEALTRLSRAAIRGFLGANDQYALPVKSNMRSGVSGSYKSLAKAFMSVYGEWFL